jgi:hypothetical protein
MGHTVGKGGGGMITIFVSKTKCPGLPEGCLHHAVDLTVPHEGVLSLGRVVAHSRTRGSALCGSFHLVPLHEENQRSSKQLRVMGIPMLLSGNPPARHTIAIRAIGG